MNDNVKQINWLKASDDFIECHKRLHDKTNTLEKENWKLQKRHERSLENKAAIDDNDCINLTIESNSAIQQTLSKNPYPRHKKKNQEHSISSNC